jgi:hypothetical protein
MFVITDKHSSVIVAVNMSDIVCSKKTYAGSEKPLPKSIKDKEPLWYRVP